MAILNREDKFKNITLDDVAVAIEILEFYLQKLQRAKSVINRFQMLTGGRAASSSSMLGGNLGFDDIVNMAIAVKNREKGLPMEETQESELSDDDIKRMKETVAKIRGDKAVTE